MLERQVLNRGSYSALALCQCFIPVVENISFCLRKANGTLQGLSAIAAAGVFGAAGALVCCLCLKARHEAITRHRFGASCWQCSQEASI